MDGEDAHNHPADCFTTHIDFHRNQGFRNSVDDDVRNSSPFRFLLSNTLDVYSI